jgi:hypothetical protein
MLFLSTSDRSFLVCYLAKHLPMNTTSLRILSCSVAMAVMLCGMSATTFAADVSTKCDTPTTEAMKAKATAQMEKDVAPYKNATGVIVEIVKQYQDELAAGWAAMMEPYCGYGGTASAVHSYDKTITRVRAAFLTNIKNPASAKIIKTTAIAVDIAPTTGTSAVKAAANLSASSGAVKKKVVTAAPSVSFSGLHRGMRSSAVMALQKKLAAYLGLSTSENVTGYFGSKTEANIIAFQLKKGIISLKTSPGAGLVGPKTTKALGAL